MSYPGCASNVKSYLWRSICQPVLLYGMECVNISSGSLKTLESTQSTLLKQCLGLNKRSKSSHILQALYVHKVDEKIKQATSSLIRRIFALQSPVMDFNSYLLSLYIQNGSLVPGTLIERCIKYGLSPVKCMSGHFKKQPFKENCGLTDSIRALVMHEIYIKPYSEQHVLTSLLTRVF